jgi:hypothetical protein
MWAKGSAAFGGGKAPLRLPMMHTTALQSRM